MQTPYLFYLSSDADASLNRVKNILESNAESQNLSSFSYEELDEMIYRLEKISLSCRQAIAEKETPKQLFRNGMFYEIPAEEKPELLSDSLDYKIEITFQNNEMHIKTPFTFKRISNRKSVKENYILIQYIQKKIQKWKDQNEEVFSFFSFPFVVVMKRNVQKFDRFSLCDNDNMENGRIVNEIFSVFNASDNVLEMDVFSCVRMVENSKDCGMEFVVFPQKDIRNHIETMIPTIHISNSKQ